MNENLLEFYSKVDPSNRLTQTSTRASFTDVWSSEGQTYLTKTVGPLEYSSDFEEKFTACLSSSTGAPFLCVPYALKDADSHFLRVVNKGDGAISLRESVWNGVDTYTDYDSSSYAGSVGTVYYYKIRRDESVGLHGTIYLYIYSDSARTNLLSTLSLGLTKKRYKFRYLYLTHNYAEAASGYLGTGYIENIERDTLTYSAPTYAFPATMSTAEVLTGNTETDPDAKITVTSSRVTADTGLNYGYTRLYKAAEYFAGSRIQFTICATGNEGAGSYLAYLGISDEGGAIREWVSGIHAGLYYDGTNYKLKVADVVSGKEKIGSASLTASTPYYCELRHHGRFAKIFIFSDSAYTTWVDTVVLHGIKDDSRWSTIYAVVTQAANATDPTWDLLDQPWDNATGWTITNTGTGVVEINPAGQAHAHPSASSTTRYQKNVGVLPSQYSIEVRQYYDALGADGSGTHVQGNYRNGQHHVFWRIYTDRFGLNAAASPSGLPDKWINLTTATATWYTWRFLIDSTNDFVKVYRKADGGEWVFIGIWYLLYVDTGNDGLVYSNQAVRGASGDCEVHEDYLKVSTGLTAPPHSQHVYGYIEIIKIETIAFDRFTFLGEGLTPTISHDGESYPGTGWTDSGGAGTTGEVSSVWKDKGTYSLHLIGKSDGTDDRAVSKTFTAASKKSWGVKARARIDAVADGHICRLFGVEQTSNGKKAGVGVYRSGSTYTWCILTYDGTTWVKTDSTHRVNLTADYDVQLQWMNDLGYNSLSASVNGTLVAQFDSTAFGSFFVDKDYIGYYGGAATFGASAERYIDSYWSLVDRLLKFGAIVRDSNGKFIVSGQEGEQHINDYTATFKVMESTDAATTFAVQKTIDTASKQDFAPTGLVRNGSTIYCFADRWDYTVAGENCRYTDVWKTSTGAANFVKVNDGGTGVNGINVTPSRLVENGKILGLFWFIPAPAFGDPNTANSYLKMAHYDIATDTWDALGTEVAHGEDYLNCFPSEGTLFRRPSDNNLVALSRWDEYKGGIDIHFQTRRVSADNGATFDSHFNLRRDWGDKAGAIAAAVVGDYVWLCGYNNTNNDVDTAYAGSQSFIMQCDPVTLEIINEHRWSYATLFQDMGNGDIVASDPDETGGFYIHCAIHSGLSLNYYRFKVGNPLAGKSLWGLPWGSIR
ncbi:MAG: hypothetical protein HY890_02840 [Deltaproteobacteria bacterium]|nr:hypothetical protein [Deltaproteobacteria bacterium]